MKIVCIIVSLLLSHNVYAGRAAVLKEKAKKIGLKAFKDLEAGFKKDLVKDINERNKLYKESKRDPENPPQTIKNRDKEWRAYRKEEAKKPGFMTQMENSRCYKVIHKFITDRRRIGEIMVLDKMGANVCAYPETSDYDQGDEDKWFKPYLEGENPYFGKAEKDKSTGLLQIQSSFLLKDKGKSIGVIVIGSKVSLGR